jgi:murein DD-endopeptidase MepM/ murein hydrolase activator NlpD
LVAPGQVIGRVGAEGDSTGAHLHLELHAPTGKAVDPMKQIHFVRH